MVALTGGALRVTTGLAVLSAGQADRLLVSGVHEDFQKRFLRDMARDAGVAGDLDRLIDCCVTLGSRARDTVGTRETAAWVARTASPRYGLVTASYHIERALTAFREAMPGLTIVAHPVTPPDVAADRWFRSPRTAWLFVAEYTKLLVSQGRQILRGYLTASATAAGDRGGRHLAPTGGPDARLAAADRRPAARVRRAVNFDQTLGLDPGIALGGCERGMAE